MVVRRIKYQGSSFGEKVGAEPQAARARQIDYKAAGGLVNIGLNAGENTPVKELLCVPVVAIHSLTRQPAVKMVPITNQQTAGVGATLQIAVSCRILGKESRHLET